MFATDAIKTDCCHFPVDNFNNFAADIRADRESVYKIFRGSDIDDVGNIELFRFAVDFDGQPLADQIIAGIRREDFDAQSMIG